MLADIADVLFKLLKMDIAERDKSLHLLLTGDLNSLLHYVVSDRNNPLQGIIIDYYTLLHGLVNQHSSSLQRLVSSNFGVLKDLLTRGQADWEDMIDDHYKVMHALFLDYKDTFDALVAAHLDAHYSCSLVIHFKLWELFLSRYDVIEDMQRAHFNAVNEIQSMHYLELTELAVKHFKTSQQMGLNPNGLDVNGPIDEEDVRTTPQFLLCDYYQYLQRAAMLHDKVLASFASAIYHAFWNLSSTA